MDKITIILREGQLGKLREHKRTTGCPIVEAIRRAIDLFLDQDTTGPGAAGRGKARRG